MRRLFAILIGVAFLAYGLLRLGVGSAMLGQQFGFYEIDALLEPLGDVATFLEEKEAQAIIPVGVTGYVGYIALMGLTLSAGAVGSIANWQPGQRLIAVFLVMYAALFINFLTINPKIVHLAVCTALFALLLWLKTEPTSDGGPQL